MMNKAGGSRKWGELLRIGPLTMLLGALLIVAGLVQTTASNGGNQSCPSGTVLIAKFNYEHSYVFEKPAGNEHVVTLSNASATGATWHSTLPVSAVLVKGGPASVLILISPPQLSGTFSNSGLPKVGHGNLPAVSNVQFCGPTTPPTTTSTSTTKPSTSTSTSTTTSTTTTTTTTPSSSTTSEPPTSSPATTSTSTSTSTSTTTTQPAPTTTNPVVTTTEPSTSTTEVSGTTVLGSTTTEVQLGSTTTAPPGVTSTTVLLPGQSRQLPFTGGQSAPLIVLGILFMATGAALTFSGTRRRRRLGA